MNFLEDTQGWKSAGDDGLVKSSKAVSLEGTPLSHICLHDYAIGNKIMIRNSVFQSIRIVILSTNFSLLIPFGPLAILVHLFNGHQVSHIGSLFTYHFVSSIVINLFLFFFRMG